ncbi:MAG: C39 family peptidase [Wenzhouxiangellaceae bacterium]
MTNLPLRIHPQPDDTTCGPTCLHAIYQYYQDAISLAQVIAETRRLDHGGTLDVFLALHALRRGYRCRIYPYNLRLFDPSWFIPESRDLSACLWKQEQVKKDPLLRLASSAYREYLQLGGEVVYRDLTSSLLRQIVSQGNPVLCGLNANYLYRSCREIPDTGADDPIGGEPSGHFVVIYGYNKAGRKLLVADPYRANPLDIGHSYRVGAERLIGSILLGALTFDANLLVISPKEDNQCNG